MQLNYKTPYLFLFLKVLKATSRSQWTPEVWNHSSLKTDMLYLSCEDYVLLNTTAGQDSFSIFFIVVNTTTFFPYIQNTPPIHYVWKVSGSVLFELILGTLKWLLNTIVCSDTYVFQKLNEPLSWALCLGKWCCLNNINWIPYTSKNGRKNQ